MPLACVACRERHLKCDGKPRCSRCLDSDQSCLYVQSRRGHRPSRKRQRSLGPGDTAIQGHADSAPTTNDNIRALHTMASFDRTQAPTSILRSASSSRLDSSTPSNACLAIGATCSGRGQDITATAGVSQTKLRELFYRYFAAAHPVVVPQAYLPQLSASAPAILDAVVNYVGAQYSRRARSNPQYLQKLQSCLFPLDSQPNGYTVLGLLLLGIVQRAHDQNDLAFATFSHATSIAFHLGMNQSNFARINSGGSPIVEEMWRRVWWELYVNGLLVSLRTSVSIWTFH